MRCPPDSLIIALLISSGTSKFVFTNHQEAVGVSCVLALHMPKFLGACIAWNSLMAMQVKGQLSTVETLDNTRNSFARLDYHDECEAAINEQIKYVPTQTCKSAVYSLMPQFWFLAWAASSLGSQYWPSYNWSHSSRKFFFEGCIYPFLKKEESLICWLHTIVQHRVQHQLCLPCSSLLLWQVERTSELLLPLLFCFWCVQGRLLLH